MAWIGRLARLFCFRTPSRPIVQLGILLCLLAIGNLQRIQIVYADEGDQNEKNWDKVFRPSVIAPLAVLPRRGIEKISFLPNGAHLLITGGDVITLWDVFSQGPVVTIPVLGRPVNSLSFSSNGRLLAGGYGKICLYDIHTWKRIDSFGWPENAEYKEVYQAFLSADGSKVVLSEHATVSIVDLHAKHRRVLDVETSPLPKIAIDPTGRYVLIGRVFPRDASPRDALLYDLERDRIAHRFKRIDDLSERAFSADGKYFGLTTTDAKAQVRKVRTGAVVRSYPGRALGFSPQGLTFAVLRPQEPSRENQVSMIDIWDVGSNVRLATIGPVSSLTRDVTFSPAGKLIATSDEWEVIVWDLERQEALFSPTDRMAEAIPEIYATSRRDDAILVTGSLSRHNLFAFYFWNHNLGRRVETWLVPKGTSAVIQREDGRWVSAGTQNNRIVLVELSSDFQMHQTREVRLATSCYYAILSDDGTKCAAVSWPTIIEKEKVGPVRVFHAEDWGMIEIWDVTHQKLLQRLLGQPVICATFDNSGNWLFAGYADGTIRKWKVDTGELASRYQAGEGNVLEISVSAAGERMVSRSKTDDSFDSFYSRVLLWDTDKDQPIAEIPSLDCSEVAMSRDGKLAAIGTRDGYISLWDCISRTPIAKWQAHDGQVYTMLFLADTKRLASVGSDGRCLIWSIPDGRELASLWHTPNFGWFCATPEGYFDYDGDETTLSYIRHVDLRTLRLLSVEETRKYYQPELVRRALARQPGD